MLAVRDARDKGARAPVPPPAFIGGEPAGGGPVLIGPFIGPPQGRPGPCLAAGTVTGAAPPRPLSCRLSCANIPRCVCVCVCVRARVCVHGVAHSHAHPRTDVPATRCCEDGVVVAAAPPLPLSLSLFDDDADDADDDHDEDNVSALQGRSRRGGAAATARASSDYHHFLLFESKNNNI